MGWKVQPRLQKKISYFKQPRLQKKISCFKRVRRHDNETNLLEMMKRKEMRRVKEEEKEYLSGRMKPILPLVKNEINTD